MFKISLGLLLLLVLSGAFMYSMETNRNPEQDASECQSPHYSERLLEATQEFLTNSPTDLKLAELQRTMVKMHIINKFLQSVKSLENHDIRTRPPK